MSAMGFQLRAFGRAANSVRSPSPNLTPGLPGFGWGRDQTESAARFFLRAREQTEFTAPTVIQSKRAPVKPGGQ
jgi:hypothetical protein